MYVDEDDGSSVENREDRGVYDEVLCSIELLVEVSGFSTPTSFIESTRSRDISLPQYGSVQNENMSDLDI